MKKPDRLTFVTARNLACCSTHTYLTSTHPSTPRLLMRPCVTQPTCWTDFSTTSPTYASKNTTPTPPGFTDHVFALCHLLGFRFAPRIRDLADKRIYVLEKGSAYPALAGLVGGTLNVRLIATHWNEILRLASSIKQGTVTASLILRKLGAYPRQNSLALALRELGRLERTLFTLQWLQSPELRQRVQLGLNKGEAKNALARAVFFNRLGELRDRSFENQRYRASGLNLVVAAIVLWNTVYLGRAVHGLREQGQSVDEYLLAHLSPLGWEHINLTGDYVWHSNKRVAKGRFRPLRSPKDSVARLFTPQPEA